MKHVVIYVPGLGDGRVWGRKLLVAGWWLYGVRPIVHQMNWADGQPFAGKLQSLLGRIDKLVASGCTVSVVGESAGASAVMNAYALRLGSIHRIAFICGKLRNPDTISRQTYLHNPAFAESMSMLPESFRSLNPEHLQHCCSVHPLRDATVPIADTRVAGMQERTIPTSGHPTSIILGNTIFSYVLISFLKQP